MGRGGRSLCGNNSRFEAGHVQGANTPLLSDINGLAINNRRSRQRSVGFPSLAGPWSRCLCLARKPGWLSYCRPIGGEDLHPKPQSSLDTEFQRLVKALGVQASMACRDIQLQTPPNRARDCLTKLCRQSSSQPTALLGCAMGHWDRAAAAEGQEPAPAKPS